MAAYPERPALNDRAPLCTRALVCRHGQSGSRAARVLTVDGRAEETARLFEPRSAISKVLSELPDDSNLEIDGTNSKYIDYDIKEILQNFNTHTAKVKNIKVISKGVSEINIIGGH